MGGKLLELSVGLEMLTITIFVSVLPQQLGQEQSPDTFPSTLIVWTGAGSRGSIWPATAIQYALGPWPIPVPTVPTRLLWHAWTPLFMCIPLQPFYQDSLIAVESVTAQSSTDPAVLPRQPQCIMPWEMPWSLSIPVPAVFPESTKTTYLEMAAGFIQSSHPAKGILACP